MFLKMSQLEIPMNSYKMALKKNKYAQLYFKDRLIINILKASFCHSSLLKDNKIFNLV